MKAHQPLHVVIPPETPFHRRAALAAARPVLSWILRLRECRGVYRDAQAAREGPFAARVLDVLRIEPSNRIGDPTAVPASGPLVVVANHPHGLLDGLLLNQIVGRTRADVRLVANHLLAAIPELRDLCFFVNPFEVPSRASRSQAGLRAALKWLRQGGSLIVFPAGEVAHGEPNATGTPADSGWHRAIGGLARSTRATVLPVFIEGCNSRWFYRAGRLHPRLRSLLLAREMLGQRGRQIAVRIGSAIPAEELLNSSRDAETATAWLRARVEALGSSGQDTSAARVDVRGAVDARMLEEDVRRLPAESRLAVTATLDVYCAAAGCVPNVLQEIGRLRELTFRAVGEGTGTETDLDKFDGHYLHLFVWNKERREIAGAYRLGPTDTIVAEHGIAGLYTSTLFRFDERLLARLSPALELGRSFVRAEYQRNSNALLLLWKGIGRFVTRSPRYRILFGPVTISSRYADVSQQLLMSFLDVNHRDGELAELVHALTPPRRGPLPAGVAAESVTDPAHVDRLIARIERDGKGMPVLLRQYLRLNARLLGFNVDPSFGDALDALMAVDLTRVDPALLRRYLGPDGAALFLGIHTAAAA